MANKKVLHFKITLPNSPNKSQDTYYCVIEVVIYYSQGADKKAK